MDWLSNRVTFVIDGVQQRTVSPAFTPKLPAEVLVGLRRVGWAGPCNWTGTRTMTIDWLYIHPITDGSPVAENDTYRTFCATPLAVGAPGVLGNDQGTHLTAALVSLPEHGAVALKPDGAFVYTPQPGFAGQDAFVYRVTQGTTDNESNAATVTIQVLAPYAAGSPQNDALSGQRWMAPERFGRDVRNAP